LVWPQMGIRPAWVSNQWGLSEEPSQQWAATLMPTTGQWALQ